MDIIAQEFKTPGNIGALARVMKNFEFTSLVLYKPKCQHLVKEAFDRATHAKDILQNAKIVSSLHYDTLIGTTSITGRDYNLRRSPITPEMLAQMDFRGNVGLIIGRESDGMSNEEIEMCDIIVTIPTTKSYPTMNVSHAAAIILYELFVHSKKKKVGWNVVYAGKEDKERLLRLIEEKIEHMPFATDQKRKTQHLAWRKAIGKSNLTKRELLSIFGFMRKVK